MELAQEPIFDLFDPILETEAGSKVYRPTLYDFLAHRALDFFRNEEPAVTRPAVGFMVDQEAYYAPAKDFAALTLPSTTGDDFKFRALSLYQELVRFHLNDKEPAALIDADLARIKYVNEKSVLPEKHDLYLKALQHLQNTYPNDLHSADVAYETAMEYYRRGTDYNPLKSDTNRWEKKNAKALEL